MTLEAFRRVLKDALIQYFPHADVTIIESRGVALTARSKLGPDTLIAVYFNSLTGKTSYALIHHGQRVAGYDNYRYWHYHPFEEHGRHVPCAEPTTEEAIGELAAVSAKLDIDSSQLAVA